MYKAVVFLLFYWRIIFMASKILFYDTIVIYHEEPAFKGIQVFWF